MEMIKGKKAYYFSLDALMAIVIIFGVILFLHPVSKAKVPEIHLQDDIISTLSYITVQDYLSSNGAGKSYIQSLINTKNITNLNQSLLELLVELDALEVDNGNAAKYLAAKFFESDINYTNSIGLKFGNSQIYPDISVANLDDLSSKKDVWTSRGFISGIMKPEAGGSITGFTAIARLTKKYNSEYFYFGGFAGQGNITAKMHYEGEIKQASVEAVFSDGFNVYVNNNFAGSFDKSIDDKTPKKYSISTSKFNSGDNYIKFTSSNSSFYIAGGYIKILYNATNNFEQKKKFYLPGIEGAVNLYDSFYIPASNLDSIKLYLNYTNNYSNFFTIGNVTVFNGKSEVQTTATLDTAGILSKFPAGTTLNSFTQKTIPIRYGLENFSQISGGGSADIVLITDLSGSMTWKMNIAQQNGISRNCNDPLINDSTTKRIDVARCVDTIFVNNILNIQGNRISLVKFAKGTSATDLTNNAVIINNELSTYNSNNLNVGGAGTCISCGINKAYEILNQQSSPDRKKYIIVMTDGLANYFPFVQNCMFGNGTGITGYCDQNNNTIGDCYGNGVPNSNECINPDVCSKTSGNANFSSCRAHNNLGATLYSIGFGPVSSCYIANKTLNSIAQCGNGSYYYSQEASELSEIYNNLSAEIANASYSSQTINTNVNTFLSPESYIELNYSSAPLSFGEVVTAETSIFGSNQPTGNFNLPALESEADYLEAKAISYSGNIWTDAVLYQRAGESAWREVFNMSEYGSSYIPLGDPFIINIPQNIFAYSKNARTDKVMIVSSAAPASEKFGSEYDKLIFTIRKNFTAPSPIKGIAKGCSWQINFTDSMQTMKIPADALDSPICIYNTGTICGGAYNKDDAVQYATCQLLKEIDFDSNGQVDIIFDQDSLKINTALWDNIPYRFGTEIKAITWR